MKITELREMLKDKRVMDEINKHLWIESQKAGYSIGIERATDEWLKLYAKGWLKFHMPVKYDKITRKKPKKTTVKRKAISKRKSIKVANAKTGAAKKVLK